MKKAGFAPVFFFSAQAGLIRLISSPAALNIFAYVTQSSRR